MAEPKETFDTAAREQAGEPAVSWPARPPGQAPGDGPGIRDRTVDAVLERLGALPATPVSGHGEAYDALHDELLKALNEDVAGQTPAGPGNAAPAGAEPSNRPGDSAR